MKIRNPQRRARDNTRIGLLQAFMASRYEADVQELISKHPEFDGLTDGELQQLALDAGLELDVEPPVDL